MLALSLIPVDPPYFHISLDSRKHVYESILEVVVLPLEAIIMGQILVIPPTPHTHS